MFVNNNHGKMLMTSYAWGTQHELLKAFSFFGNKLGQQTTIPIMNPRIQRISSQCQSWLPKLWFLIITELWPNYDGTKPCNVKKLPPNFNMTLTLGIHSVRLKMIVVSKVWKIIKVSFVPFRCFTLFFIHEMPEFLELVQIYKL